MFLQPVVHLQCRLLNINSGAIVVVVMIAILVDSVYTPSIPLFDDTILVNVERMMMT